MTYNQVLKRIETIVRAHKQVRHFGRGLLTDFLSDKTISYAAVFLEDGGASINPGSNTASFSFRMRFADLVHVSGDTKENELDVLSDMFSVAMDIIAQLSYPGYNDWRVSLTNNMQSLVEQDGDMYAGWYVDMQIAIMYSQNVCQVPTTITDYIPIDTDLMKLVYDYPFTATGTEGSSIVIAGIAGKKILFVTREYSPLYPVSNLPNTTEYTWDGTTIGLNEDLPTQAGERFLILYRSN